MKGNSYILINSLGNRDLLNYETSANMVNENPHNDSSPEVPSNKLQNSNFLNNFWKRLVFNPLSFSQGPNASIFSILEEETDLVANDSIKLVLSKELELPLNSEELLKAIENSFKIFHEDYPGDFILEYKGKRLGLMMLDRCSTLNGEEKLIYRFNPQIKSFKGLF